MFDVFFEIFILCSLENIYLDGEKFVMKEAVLHFLLRIHKKKPAKHA